MMLWRIQSTTKSPLDPSREWFGEFRRTNCCSVCMKMLCKHRSRPQNVVVMIAPQRYPLYDLVGAHVQVINTQLRASLGRDGDSGFLYGTIRSERGRSDQHYMTMIASRPLLMRSSRLSRGYCCLACRRTIYSPNPIEKGYVLKGDLTGAQVYECDFGGLIIAQAVLDRIQSAGLRGFYTQPIPVRDEPIDGMGLIDDYY